MSIASALFQLEISGGDSMSLLERLCTGRMDMPVGQCLFTLMLNSVAGIEAVVNVARTEKHTFILSTAAPYAR